MNRVFFVAALLALAFAAGRGVAETTSLEQIKQHYYGSQRQVNPTGIVPVGPQLDFAAKHDRARIS